MTIQLIEYERDGDNVRFTVSSKELEEHGWKRSKSSTPAAYLTGYLAGKKAQEQGITEAILDIGLKTPRAGMKLYGALKGAVDSGLDVPHSPKIFPSEDRLQGKHIKEDVAETFSKVKDSIENGK